MEGYADNATDCDDDDETINPDAEEICDDGIDQNCDLVEETCPLDDNDGDGYDEVEDCDDENAAVNPGAEEVCDGIDNDCDLDVDEDTGYTDYLDYDEDGYGDPDNSLFSCDEIVPEGYVENDEDCDDADADLNQDDLDEDGYSTCDEDCDDEDPDVNPDAEEVFDGIDNDCNDEVDEDTEFGLEICFHDFDGSFSTMSVYLFNESAWDYTWWFQDIDGDGLLDPYAVIDTEDQCLFYEDVDEGDEVEVNAHLDGNENYYLVYGNDPDDTHASVTCNGHEATVEDNGNNGGDLVCVAEAFVQ